MNEFPSLLSTMAFGPPIGLTIVGLLLGVLVRRTILVRLARSAARTSSRADDALVAALRGPVVVWGAVLGLYVAVQIAAVPRPVGRVVQQVIIVLLMVSATWALARLGGDVVRARARAAVGPVPSANLVTNLTRASILLLGGLVILQTLGISITPLLTAFGVGGLAIGLALQDTLANLFAGIHILVSRQVRPGDFIRLSSGEEGYVQDVTWRYTTIRQLSNDLIIVPNAKLASAVTANFNLPDAEQAVLVDVGVSYSSDLSEVERVTVEVGQEVMHDVEGGVPGFAPFIRYHTFADSSIQFTAILRGQDYVSQYLVKHEFIKRLHRRYREEGIEIPFPMRTVQVRSHEGREGFE